MGECCCKQGAEHRRAAGLMGARMPAPACCQPSSQRWTALSQPQVACLEALCLYILAAHHDNGQIPVSVKCLCSHGGGSICVSVAQSLCAAVWYVTCLHSAGVVVLAATNRADVLDAALMRPGRFDVQLHVPLPDLASRKAILEVHTRGMPLDPTVDLQVEMLCYTPARDHPASVMRPVGDRES